MSSCARRPSLVEAATRIVRIDCAVRPSLPITLPMSPGATRSSRIELWSPSISVTSTPSGSSTRDWAMVSIRSFNAIVSLQRDSGLRFGSDGRVRLQQTRERGGRQRALVGPVVEASAIDLERTGGIEHADVLDVTAVARTAVVGDHDAVEGDLFRAVAREANVDCHELLEISEGREGSIHGTPCQ